MNQNEVIRDIAQKAFAAADALTIKRMRTASTVEARLQQMAIMDALRMALIEFNNILDGDTD